MVPRLAEVALRGALAETEALRASPCLAEAAALLHGTAADAADALALARRESARIWVGLRDSPDYDSLTYWDAVPEDVESAYACAALLAAAADALIGPVSRETRRALDVAVIVATAAPGREASRRRADALLDALALLWPDAPAPAARRPTKRQRNVEAPPPLCPDDGAPLRLLAPTAKEFQEHVRTRDTPVVLVGVIDDWAACNEWKSVRDLVRGHEGRTVPVEAGVYDGGAGDGRSQSLMTLAELADAIKTDTTAAAGAEPRAERPPYLAQHRLFDQIPSLAKAFSEPRSLTGGGAVASAWVGAAATFTPAHADPRDNLFAQVSGVKRWRLWPPSAAAPEAPPAVRVDIRPGQLLYVPRGWWHDVQALEPAISISFWFDTPTSADRAAGRGAT
ncbi:hypothetical protein M885DRAFT_521642 [Pelagophyceae sp. CCMP2097]|nr:hypothetical protein M885DRAFT_521642 [Pelagophyceae sp. CCMP2097]